MALGLQLAASAFLMALMTLIHTLGLFGISRVLGLRSERLQELSVSPRSVGLMCSAGLLIFALHTAEILVFAGVYLLTGAMETVEEALYYSASAYATLGRTADYFPEDWRLLGAIEALIGFLLIGWSTAFVASKATKLLPD
jgi:hypothetical protein